MKLYPILLLKREIEYLLLLPFILYGKWKASRKPLKEEYDLICFFPTYGLGGAEKVNADVISCFPHKKILVVFCKKSPESSSLHLFQHPHVTLLNIGDHTDRAQSFSNFIYRGIFSYHVNKQKKKTVVFIGQCNFGYKLLPHLRKDTRKVELIHTTEKKFAWVTFPYITYLDYRIMVGRSIIEKQQQYYDELGIPRRYKDRIRLIFYASQSYANKPAQRTYEGKIKVFYGGRGGYQKRVHLIVEIIRKCQAAGLPIEMHFVGSHKEELPEDILQTCYYHGKLNAGAEMNQFQQGMDVLLMTSAFEGFPIVIMESLNNGIIPVVTAVDAIPEHIKNGWNGFIIRDPANEESVIEQGYAHLKYICEHRSELPRISENCLHYAKEHFSTETFCAGYSKAFDFS